jgi:hypothetical protein
MSLIFGCEEATLFDQRVIEAHEGIEQLRETLAYLHTHGEQDGMGEEGQETEQKFEQAAVWCQQADEMIARVGALFETEMVELRARQEVMLAAWREARQAAPVWPGEPVPA